MHSVKENPSVNVLAMRREALDHAQALTCIGHVVHNSAVVPLAVLHVCTLRRCIAVVPANPNFAFRCHAGRKPLADSESTIRTAHSTAGNLLMCMPPQCVNRTLTAQVHAICIPGYNTGSHRL